MALSGETLRPAHDARRRFRLARGVLLSALVCCVLLLGTGSSAWADDLGNLTPPLGGSPTIASDKADYSPGDTVVLSGSNWAPGESVHITVNDDVGSTWTYEADVTADGSGGISNSFQLPDSFIAAYRATATGPVSGSATTTFTDGNVKVTSAGGRDFTFTSTLYSSANCTTGAGATSAPQTADANGTAVGVGSSQSVLIAASGAANAPNASATFSNWTQPGNPAVVFAAGYSATDQTVCVVGFQSGNRDLVGNYSVAAPQVASINRAASSPTNTAGSVSWTVVFSKQVTGVDAADFALVNTGLAGSPAITSVSGSGTTYTVTASTGTGSGTLGLNLNDNDTIVDAGGSKLGGTGTGTVGSGGTGNGSFQGQVYTIDRTGPVIAATAATLPDNAAYTANTWTNKNVRVTFACTDAGGSGKATDTASGSTDVTAETTSSGTTVTSGGACTDNAGNVAAAASFGPVKIDKTAPAITDLGPTSSPNASGWYKADVTNRFKATDALSGLNSACLAAYPDVGGDRIQSKTTSGEGTAVKVTSDSCTDQAGNSATGIDSAGFKIDKTAPQTSDDSDNAWHGSEVTVHLSASDPSPGSGVDETFYKVDAEASAHEGSSVLISAPADHSNDGIHTVTYWSVDKAGNVESSHAATVRIDTRGPATSDDADASWHSSDVTVHLTASDPGELATPQTGSGVDKTFFKVGGEATAHGGTSVPIAAPGDGSNDGSHTIEYWSTDKAGNAEAHHTATVKIDATKPTVSLTLQPASPDGSNGFYTSQPTVHVVADDANLDTLVCKEGATALTVTPTSGSTHSAEGDVQVSGDGAHAVGCTATDKGSNSAGDSKTYKLDSAKPQTSDDSDNAWHGSDVTVHLSASDPSPASGVDKTFYKVDAEASAHEGSSVLIAAPADHSNDGIHTVTYWSVDKAGNVESSHTATVRIDTRGPATSDDAPTAWQKSDVTVHLSANDPGADDSPPTGSGVAVTHYSVDSDPTIHDGTSASIPVPADHSNDGTHTIHYWSVDNAGNTESEHTATVKIDTTTSESKAFSPTYNNATTIPVSYTASDPGTDHSGLAKVELWAKGPSDSSYHKVATDSSPGATGSVSYTPTQGDGSYAFYTVSEDAAGNREAVPTAADDVTVVEPDAQTLQDTAPPGTTDDAPAAWQNADVAVHLSASDPGADGTPPTGSGVDKTYYKVDGEASPHTGASVLILAPADHSGDGAHTIEYWSVDKATNEETHRTATVRIDTSEPHTTDNADSGWHNTNQTLTLTATDPAPGSGVAATHYRIDSDPTVHDGTSVSIPAPADHSNDGIHTVHYWSVDNATNTESEQTATVKIDTTKPVTTDDAPAGWQNSDLTVHLSATDTSPGSGVDKTFYRVDAETTPHEGTSVSIPAPADHSNDGTHTIHYWSVDNAGNTESEHTASVKVDTTKPSSQATSPTYSNAGESSFSVTYTASDPGSDHSGIATVDLYAKGPSDTEFHKVGTRSDGLGSGNFTYTPTQGDGNYRFYTVATDGANNGESPPAGADDVTQVSGVSNTLRDTVPPATTDDAPTTWQKSAVTVHLTAHDPGADATPLPTGSGVDTTYYKVDGGSFTAGTSVSIPAPADHSGDGLHTITYYSTDKAGNQETEETATVRIDTRNPATTDNADSGWHNTDQTVTLTATDPASGSGVAHTYYKVDGGSQQEGTSVQIAAPTNHSNDGAHTIAYWSADNAGNVETEHTASVMIDTTNPQTSDNAPAGWRNSDVSVTLAPTDPSPGSGIDNTYYKVDGGSFTVGTSVSLPAPPDHSNDGTHTITYYSKDKAGNQEASRTATVRIDTANPGIVYVSRTAPNGNGWNNGDVTVNWSCTDGLSGPTSANVSKLVSAEGASLTATGTCADNAGNSASDTQGGIKIDKHAPDVKVTGTTNGAQFTLGAVPTAGCDTTDSLSGVDTNATATTTGGQPSGVGSYTVSCGGGKDKAGNAASAVTATYTVIYRWDGFLQPINDTAHQVGLATSIFKGGSTVPVKFQLKRADGTVVQAAAAPLWITPLKGAKVSDAVDESIYSDPITTGTTYRWDGDKYIYNWGTDKSQTGYYWRVGVKFDDSQTYYVNLGLR